METLANLPEYSFEAQQMYISTLDITKALNEAHRLSDVARKKAEHEAEQARLKEEEVAKKAAEQAGEEVLNNVSDVPEQKQPEKKQWVSFRCLLTVEDAQTLGQFFKAHDIAFEQI